MSIRRRLTKLEQTAAPQRTGPSRELARMALEATLNKAHTRGESYIRATEEQVQALMDQWEAQAREEEESGRPQCPHLTPELQEMIDEHLNIIRNPQEQADESRRTTRTGKELPRLQ